MRAQNSPESPFIIDLINSLFVLFFLSIDRKKLKKNNNLINKFERIPSIFTMPSYIFLLLNQHFFIPSIIIIIIITIISIIDLMFRLIYLASIRS